MKTTSSNPSNPVRREKMGTIALSLVCALGVAGVIAGGVSVSDPVITADVWRDLPTEIVTRGKFRKIVSLTAEVRPYQPVTVAAECYLRCRIIEMVPEGTLVKKGDVVMRLDATELEGRMKDRQLRMIRYQNLRDRADAQEQIQASTNQSSLSAAQWKSQLADGALLEWEQAEYQQLLTELNDDCRLSRENLATVDNEYEYVRELARKGIRSWGDVERVGYGLQRAQRDLDLARGRKNLLRKFDQKRRTVSLQTAASIARNNVARAELKNSVALTNARLLTVKYERSLGIYRGSYEQYKQSVEACTITAPVDGEVAYANSWSRQSHGSKYIEVGNEVRHRQDLFSLIDRRQQKLKGRVTDRFASVIQAGQKVDFKVSGSDEVLKAHVSWISPHAFARSSYTPDLRDHWVEILIDEPLDRIAELSPRQDVDATILIDGRSHVLQVPVHSVIEYKGQMVILRKTREGNKLQPITIGQTTDEVIEITAGANEGDEVYVAPAEQLRELARSL
jgi:HlyD family secretion protein